MDDRRYACLVAMLRDAVAILAAPPERQIAYLDALSGSYDELGLEFDDVVGAVLGAGRLDDEAVRAVRALDGAVTAIRGRANAELWCPEGLRERAEWIHIRQLAEAARPPWRS